MLSNLIGRLNMKQAIKRKLALLAVLVAFQQSAFADTFTTLSIGSLPGSVTYSNSFSAMANGTTFYDDYYFTIPTGMISSVTSSVSLSTILGLGNIQARLYAGNSHITGPAGPFLVKAWGSVANFDPNTSVSTVVLNSTALTAGTYTLQIKGTVTGTAGGSYAGILNVAEVPEPETYGMLLIGLGLLGFVAHRKHLSV
jgi:hypothetical protein